MVWAGGTVCWKPEGVEGSMSQRTATQLIAVKAHYTRDLPFNPSVEAMMELRVTWTNATRCNQEKECVEFAYLDRLLELFGSAANAFVPKQQFELQHHPVGHQWQKYNILAHVDACKNLTPSEKHLAHFKVSFLDG